MTDLPSHEVHLWQADYEHFVFAFECDNSVLSVEERNYAERFHSREHRRRYLLTKALVRFILAGYLQIEAQHIRFAFNAYGKPFLNHWTDLEFNCSHARNLLLIAVRRSAPIGIDLEHVHALTDLLGVAATVFAPRELAALITAPSDERTSLFFRLWVQKEAYIKALGVGFSAPTTEIDMESKVSHISLDATRALVPSHRIRKWMCWTFMPHRDFSAALVTRSANLTLRQFVLTPQSLL